MKRARKLLTFLLALTLCLSLSGCRAATPREDTLVYGSNDYTRINPAMDEHC